jgi:hypothetical protein
VLTGPSACQGRCLMQQRGGHCVKNTRR